MIFKTSAGNIDIQVNDYALLNDGVIPEQPVVSNAVKVMNVDSGNTTQIYVAFIGYDGNPTVGWLDTFWVAQVFRPILPS
jgi:hypothetical protein